MCSPMKEPICLVENVNGSLCVNAQAIEYLSKNNQPVVVVSVVGLYRTGKSYLMNRLAGKQTGFALGSTIESKTKGIWMWCVQHPYNAEQTLLLLDTEGLGDVHKGDSKNDAWIFCLAVLLSTTLVYNSRGTIDNTAVENLHYVTELAEQIKIKSPASQEAEEEEEENEVCQFVQFFPNFIWTVRDFTLELVIANKGQVTEDEYLEFGLQLKKGINVISSGEEFLTYTQTIPQLYHTIPHIHPKSYTTDSVLSTVYLQSKLFMNPRTCAQARQLGFLSNSLYSEFRKYSDHFHFFQFRNVVE